MNDHPEWITQCHCGCARSVHVDRAGYCTLCGVCPRYRVRTAPLTDDRPASHCRRCPHPEHQPGQCKRTWPDVANPICVCQAAPVAQLPVKVQPDDYQAMQAGVTPDNCRCTMTSPERMDTYDGPQPAEWEQADDCPVHQLTVTVHPDPFSRGW